MPLMAAEHTAPEGRRGDWVEVRGIDGEVLRRGQIVERLGGPGHEHFQVRWNADHESMVFPGEGVRIVPSPSHAESNAGS